MQEKTSSAGFEPSPSASPASADVLIVGGGVVGSAVAYFLSALKEGSREPSVVVVEPDPTYARASTALSVGGIRQQFSTPENIRLSQASLDFLRAAPDLLRVGDEAPALGLVEAGYLFLASPAGHDVLLRNHRLQVELGVDVEVLDPEALRARFPWLNSEGIAAGSLGCSGEGWLDPYALLQAFRRKAVSLGVRYVRDRVTGMARGPEGRVDRVRLASGTVLRVGSVVNAAGARAAEVARMAGVGDLPVHPRKRIVFRIRCRQTLPDCPLVIDPTGVYFRPEGDGFLCGTSPPPEMDPDTYDLQVDHRLFEEAVWPVLAHRVPAFERLRVMSAWAGLYAVNVRDHNAILGPHPEVANLYFANGFSGHGLQHAPAVGRAIAELLLYGAYRSLDLRRFSFDRLRTGPLLEEANVV